MIVPSVLPEVQTIASRVYAYKELLFNKVSVYLNIWFLQVNSKTYPVFLNSGIDYSLSDYPLYVNRSKTVNTASLGSDGKRLLFSDNP